MDIEVNERVLDRDVALARVGGDAELLKELAELFLEEYPRLLAELHAASHRSDARALERTAHGLKGSVANFGARPAVEAALRVEHLGRDQKMTEVEHALRSLELALAAVHVELATL